MGEFGAGVFGELVEEGVGVDVEQEEVVCWCVALRRRQTWGRGVGEARLWWFDPATEHSLQIKGEARWKANRGKCCGLAPRRFPCW